MRSVAKIRVLCLVALAVVAGANNEVFAATYNVAQTGDWTNPATWDGTQPANSISINENITINVPIGCTLTIDTDVLIQHTNESRIITLSGEGLIKIADGKTFFLQNTATSGQTVVNTNRVNLQCDIKIEENATLKLDVHNVAFDSEHDISGSGTVNFSRTGSSDRQRIRAIGLTKPITECHFLFASPQKFTYLEGCTYVLPGTYNDMSCKDALMYVYDNVVVTGNSWLESGGITYVSKSDKAKISFNNFTGDSNQPLTLNVDATLKSIGKVSSLTVADTNTLTVAGDITWKTSRLPGIVIESGKTLTLPSDVATTLTNNVSIAEGGVLKLNDNKTITFDSNASISGAGTLNFAGTATINNLKDCLTDLNVTFPALSSKKTITYGEASTCILAKGDYYNLTLNSTAETISLCGDINVTNNFTISRDQTIESGGTLTVANFVGNSKTFTSNVDVTVNNNISNGKFVVNSGRFTNNSDGKTITDLTVNSGAVFETTKTVNISNSLTNGGSIVIGSEAYLNINNGKTLTFSTTGTPTISGTGTLNFVGSATINGLNSCFDGLTVTFNGNPSFTYGEESSCILAYDNYYNLTLNSTAETITLCGNVNVTNDFKISRDQKIGSGGTLTVKNFYGGSNVFTNNTDVTVSSNITGKFVLNAGTFTNNSDGKTITDLTVNSGATFKTKGLTVAGTLTLGGGELEIVSDKTLTATANPIQVNGNSTIKSSEAEPAAKIAVNEIDVASGALTIEGNVTSNNSITIDGAIDIASGAVLNIADGKTLTFSATGNPTISGAGTLNFAGAATINGLATCLNVNTITFPAVSNKKNITYGEESTCILAGVYYNLTLNSTAESITLCDDVNVTNNFTINGNHTLNGTGTLTAATITENGASLTNNVDITASNITINSEAFAFGEEGTGDLSIGTLKLGNDVTLSGRALTVSYLNGNSKKLTTNVDVTVNNENAGLDKISIEINNGSTFNRNCTGAITNLTVNSGGKFETNRDVTISGTLTLNGGEIEMESGKTLTATANPIQVNGNSTIKSSEAETAAKIAVNEIDVASGALTIEGNVTSNNNITIDGDVNIASGAVLNIADGRTLTFSGTPNITGAGTLNFAGTATINNLTDCLTDLNVTFPAVSSKKTITYGGTSDHIIAATNYYNLVINSTVDSLTLCGNVTTTNFTINNDYKLGGDGNKLTVNDYYYGNSHWFKTYIDVTVYNPALTDRTPRIKNGKFEVNRSSFFTQSRPDASNPIEGLIINDGKFETTRSLIVSTPIELNGGELKTKYKVELPTQAINVSKSAIITTSSQAYEAEINISEGAILSVASFKAEDNNNYFNLADFSNKVTGDGTIKVTNGSTLKLNDNEIGGLIVDNGGTLQIGQNMDVTGNATFAGTVNGAYTITVKGTEVTFDSPTFGTNNKVFIDGNAKISGANDCFTGVVTVANNKNITYDATSSKILALADASGSYGSLTIEGTAIELCTDATVSGALTIANDLTITGTNKTLTINGSVVDASGAEEKKTITVSGTTVAISSTATEVEPKIDVVGGTLTHSGTAQLTDLTVDGSSTFIVKTGADVTVENPTLAGILTVETGAILTLTGEISLDNGLTINNHGTIKIGDGIVNSVLPCTFAVAENAKVTYGEGSTNILGGEYDKLTINSSNVTLCNNVTVGGAFAIAGNTEISSSEGIKALTLNGAVNAENKTITVNGANMLIGDAVAAVQGGMSIVVNANGSFTNNRSCTIAGVNVDGGSAAIGAQTTITNNLAVANGSATFGAATTVGGNISVASAGAVNVNATTGVTGNLSVADGGTVNVNAAATVSGDASLLGAIVFADGENKTLTVAGEGKTVTFNHSTTSIDAAKAGNLVIASGSTIAGLEDCYEFSFASANPSITYAESSTKIVTGTYGDLTIQGSGISLCGEVTVNGAFTTADGMAITENLTLNGAVNAENKTFTVTGADMLIAANAGAVVQSGMSIEVNAGATFTANRGCTLSGVDVDGGSATIGAQTAITNNLAVANGSATLGAATTVGGNISIAGGGAVNVNATTGVTGNLSVADGGTVNVNAAATVGGDASLLGTIAFADGENKPLSVAGENKTVTFNHSTTSIDVAKAGNLVIRSGSIIAGLEDCYGFSFDVEKPSVIYAASSTKVLTGIYTNLTINSSSIELCDNVTVEGALAVDADVTLTGGHKLTLKGEATGGKTITASGAQTAIEIDSENNIAASFVLGTGTSLTTTNRSCTVGSVTVEGGSATIGAATTVNGDVTISSGVATINAGLNVSGDLAVSGGSATIGATTTVNGDLAVSGGSVAIAAATTVSDDFTIGGEVTITNTNVTVTSGDFIVSSNGAVAVEGSSTVTGNVNLAGAANGAINLSAANASLTVGGGTITIPAISKVSDVSKFHIVGTSTIAGLADCVEGLDISGNITYAASSPVIQVSDEYEDLTILGTNVSLCGDVTASGTLTWDSGIITLGTNNLTVGNISSSNAFGGTHMMVSGGLGEDAGQLTMTDLSGSVEFPVGTMAGSTAQYTPIIFSSITADATPSITVSTDNHTAEGGIDHDLKRTWTVSSSNVTSAKLDFKFVSADDPTHLSMGVAHNGTVMGGSVNNSTFTMTTISAVTDFNGIWTAKLSGRFIYSYQDGNWDDPETWTDKEDGSVPTGGVGSVTPPMSTDNVTIFASHTVTAGASAQYANTVSIFGTLNLGSQETHFQYLGGTGCLIQTGTYNVGGADCNDAAFRSADGGTLVLNGDFSGQTDFRFNNLTLNNSEGDDLVLTLDADKGTMNGSLTLEGDGSITVNGNFATATNGEIDVNANSTFAGNVTTGSINVSANKQLTVSGDRTITATAIAATATGAKVVVDGNATVTTDAVLTGAIEVNNEKALTVAGTGTGTDVTFSGLGNVVLKAGETFEGTIRADRLEIEEGAIVNANLIITGALDIAQNAKINGTVTVGNNETTGTLTVASGVEFSEAVNVTGSIVATSSEGVTFGGTVSATGNVAVGDNAAFAGNVDVDGNLTAGNGAQFNGTSSTVEVDGDITLGSNALVEGSVTVEGNLTVGGDSEFDGAVTVGTSETSHTLTLGSNVEFKEAVLVYGDIVAASNEDSVFKFGKAVTATNITLGNGAQFNGASSTVAVTGDMTLGDNAVVKGTVTANSVNIGSGANVSAAVTTVGNLTVDADATISGAVTVGGTATVGNGATVSNIFDVTGDATFGNNATITGEALSAANLTLGGNATVSAAVTATGNMTVGASGAISGTVTVGTSGNDKTLTVASGVVFSGTVAVTGDIAAASSNGVKFQNNVSATGDIALGNNAEITGTTVLADNLTLGNAATVSAAVTTTGNLTVGDGATISSTVAVTGDATIGSGATITGDNLSAANLTLGSSANVSAAITTGNLTIGGGTLSGAATVSGAMTMNGDVTVSNAVTVAGTFALGSNTLTINGASGVVNANGALTFDGATVSGTGAIHINNTLPEAAITLNVATADLNGSFTTPATVTVGSGATLTNNRTSADQTISNLTVNGKFISIPGITLASMTVNDGGEVELNGVTTMTGLAMYGSTSKLTAAADAYICGGKLAGTITANSGKQISFAKHGTGGASFDCAELVALNGNYIAGKNIEIDYLVRCVGGNFNPNGNKVTYQSHCTHILNLKQECEYDNFDLYAENITLCGDITVNGNFNPTASGSGSGTKTFTINGDGYKFIVKSNVTAGTHDLVYNNVEAIFGNTAEAKEVSVRTLTLKGTSTFNIIENAQVKLTTSLIGELVIASEGAFIINTGAQLTTDRDLKFTADNQEIRGGGALTISTTKLTGKFTNYATINIAEDASVSANNEFDIKNGGTLNHDKASTINKIIVNEGANFNIGDDVTVNNMTLTGGVTQIAAGKTLAMKNGVSMALSGNDTIVGGTGSAISGKLVMAESTNLSIKGSIGLDQKLSIANNVTLTGVEGENATLSWSANKEVETATGKQLTIAGDLKFEGDITLNGAIKIDGETDKLKLGGGTVTFNSATDFAGTTGKLAFVGDATISGLVQNPNIAYANVDCMNNTTVTYAANCTRMLPGSHYNLTINSAIADISLLDDVEVRSALSWTAGRIHLGNKKLTISQNNLPGEFSPTFMVVVGDGGRLVYKAPSATTTLKMPVGTHTQDNMGVSVYQYTPVSFGSLSSIGENDTVSVQVKNQPKTGKASDLRRYWTVKAKSGVTGSLVFNYNTADDPYNHISYLKVYRYEFDGVEGGIVAGTANETEKTISVNTTNINGIWSAIEFPPVTTLYSFKSGEWWDPKVWTTVSTGSTWENPLKLTPDENYDVVILFNHMIKGGTDVHDDSENPDVALKHTNIKARSIFLDGFDTELVVYSDNIVDINVMKGNGTLLLNDRADFPNIRHTSLFMAADGGTTEFCGSPAYSEFDLGQAEFNHLSINYTNPNMKLNIAPSDGSKLQINGDLTLTSGTLVFTEIGKAIHVEGNVEIAANGTIINNSGAGKYDQADTLQIAGNFDNHGLVRLTLRTWENYADSVRTPEGTLGRGILRFVGTANSNFDCYNRTNISQLIVDKDNKELTVVLKTHNDERNFGLLGQAVNGKIPAGFEGEGAYPENPTELLKPLWLKRGVLELQELTHIRSLAEPYGNNNDRTFNKDCFYIPYDGGLKLNGPHVKVEPTISDEPVVAWSSVIPAGRFIVNSGTYDGKGSSGVTFVGSTHIEVNGGTVKWASFRPSQFSYNGQTSYTQTNGEVFITGLGDAVTTSPLFFMPLSSYVFNMSGGKLEIESSSSQGSFVVKSNPTDGGITGGEIIINTGMLDNGLPDENGNIIDRSSGSYKISTELPFYNLTLKNEQKNRTGDCTPVTYVKHYLFDVGNTTWNNKIPYSIKANTVIQHNLKIEKGVVFDTQGKTVTVGGDLQIDGAAEGVEAAKVYAQSGEFILNGEGHLIIDGTVVQNADNQSVEGFYNLTIADGAKITSDHSFTVRNKFTLGNNAELRDGADGNTYTMLRNVVINGTHAPRATGPATMLLKGGGTGGNGSYLYSNGNGVLNNVTINTTQATLNLRDPDNADRATKLTINGRLNFASATRFYIGISNLELGSSASVTASVSSGFGPDCMIQTYGPSATAGGVTKVYDENHKSFTFPFGCQIGNYYYLPATISVGGAETYGKITSRPVSGSAFRVANQSLKCYWVTDETGFVNAVNRHQEYKFYHVYLANNSAVGYVGARRSGGNWDATFGDVESSTVGDMTEWKVTFSRNDITNVNGYYTAGKPGAFGMQILCSSNYLDTHPGADWSDWQCWSSEVGGEPIGEGTVPSPTTAVIIGDADHHHTISTSENITASSLTIAPGSTLDLAENNATFTIVEVDEAVGAGTIRIGRDYFPEKSKSDFGKFLGEHGGTVEYYGFSDTILTNSPTTYYNLVISAGTDENHPITMPNKNIAVYNNFTVKGWVQSDTTAARSVTVNDSLIVESGGLLLRNNEITNQKQTYTVKGSVVVNNNGTIKAAGLSNGSIAEANMNKLLIHRNLTVDGTFNATNGNNRFDTEFTGDTTSVVSGNANIKFNKFICNKDHLADSLILRTKDVESGTVALASLQRGTFAVDIDNEDQLTFCPDTMSIPQNVRLSVLSGKILALNLATDAIRLKLEGHISVEGGSLVVGNAANSAYNSIVYAAEGKPSITINGGRLEVVGQISMNLRQTTGSLVWNQTGGEVVINGKHRNDGPVWLSSFGALHIQDAGEFNMSGGTLTIMNGGGGDARGDIYIKPVTGSVNCTGGEIIIGGGSQKLLTNAPLYNLKVANGATLNAYDNINVNRLTIERTGVYNALNHDLAIRSEFINRNNNSTEGSTISQGFVAGSVNQHTRFTGENVRVEGVAGYHTQFAQLEIDGNVDLEAGKTSIRIGGNLVQNGGTVDDHGNIIHLFGDLTCRGSFEGTGGINFCRTDDKQLIDGNALCNIATITVSNSHEVWLNTNLRVNNKVKLDANLYIDRCRLYLGENATVEAVTGETLSATRMIRSNGMHEDHGVTKYVPQSTSAFSFTLPLGVNDADGVGRYTPAKYEFAFNNKSGASITVTAMNFRHHNLSVEPTKCIDYYWSVVSDGFGDDGAEFDESASDDYSVRQTYTFDTPVQGDGDEPMLPEYLYYGGIDEFEWMDLTGDAEIDGNNIIFNHFGHINGDYTAGAVNTSIYNARPVLYTSDACGGDGGREWNTLGTWLYLNRATGLLESYDGTPDGNPIHIQPGHRVYIDGTAPVAAYCLSFDTERKMTPSETMETVGMGILDIGQTQGSSFGKVDGVGRLVMSPNGIEYKIPSGDFEVFLNNPESIIEFTGSTDAKLPNSIVGHASQPLQNVVLSGTGTKILTKETGEYINGSMTIEAGARLAFNNTPIYIKGDWVDQNTNQSGFDAGNSDSKSIVEFNGTSQQTIKLSNDDMSFWKLKINNPAGVKVEKDADVSGATPLTISKELIFANGCLTTTDNSCVVITNSTTISGYGPTMFVNGPMVKEMLEHGDFTYPIGTILENGTKMYGPASITNVSVGDNWKASYHFDDQSYEGVRPLNVVSQHEYWKFSAPENAANATAKLGLYATINSMENCNNSMLNRMMVIGLINEGEVNANKWEMIRSSHTGSTLPTTFTTTNAVTIADYQRYALGYVGIFAMLSEEPVSVCDGDEQVQIPITFNGLSDHYTIEFEVRSGDATHTDIVDIRDGNSLTFTGNDLGGFFGRTGGFVPTDDDSPFAYQVRLTNVWEGETQGNASGECSVSVLYNTPPEIVGPRYVGVGETREFSVKATAWDDAFSWQTTDSKADIKSPAVRITDIEFDQNNMVAYNLTLTAGVSYKMGDYPACSTSATKYVEVKSKPQPVIHCVTTDDVFAACKAASPSTDDDIYVYQTAYVAGHSYVWNYNTAHVESAVVDEDDSPNQISIKWKNNCDGSSSTLKVTESAEYHYTNNKGHDTTEIISTVVSQAITLYDNVDFNGEISALPVCDGNNGAVVVSPSNTNLHYELFDSSNNPISTESNGYSNGGALTLTTNSVLAYTAGGSNSVPYKVRIRNTGCSRMFENDSYAMTVRDNPNVEIGNVNNDDLYVGNLAQLTWQVNNSVTLATYSFAYSTDGVTYAGGTPDDYEGLFIADRNIKIKVPDAENNQLKGQLTVNDDGVGGTTCSSVIPVASTANISGDFLWKGVTSDWNAGTNWWKGSAPDGTQNAVVRSGYVITENDEATNDGGEIVAPIISGEKAVNNITVAGSGMTVTVEDKLTINGDVTSSGSFVGGGEVVLSAGEHTVESASASFIKLTNNGTTTVNGDITVTGNINNSGSFAGEGDVVLSGTAAQTVNGNGSFTDVYVNNGNNIHFTGHPTINGAMTLYNGLVYANQEDEQIIFSTSGSLALGENTEENPKQWIVGNVKKTWAANKQDEFHFYVGGDNRMAQLDITPDHTGSTFTVSYTCDDDVTAPITTNLGNDLTRVSGKEFWNIDGIKANGVDKQPSTIKFHWADAAASGIGIMEGKEVQDGENAWKSALVIAHKKEGENWEIITDYSLFADNNYISIHATDYSLYTYGAKAANPVINPLPVTFVSFTGRQEENTVELEWATMSELNNDYFEIERSTDGVNFMTIGYVNGSGNSRSLLNYQFADNAPEQGQLYYRLSQVDFDGKREYADKIVAVFYQGEEINNLTVVPNPTNGLFRVSANGSMVGGVIELLSQTGAVVRVVNVDSFDAQLDISDLPNGIYILRYRTENKILQQKVVKY